MIFASLPRNEDALNFTMADIRAAAAISLHAAISRHRLFTSLAECQLRNFADDDDTFAHLPSACGMKE